MHANQKTFVRDGVSIPLPVRTVDLHVSRTSPVVYWCICKTGWSLNVALLTTR
jgi:hypothetical protein